MSLSFALTHAEAAESQIVVLGLSQAERIRKKLLALGFKENDSQPGLRIDARQTYSSGFFQFVKDAVLKSQDALEFRAAGQEIGVTWLDDKSQTLEVPDSLSFVFAKPGFAAKALFQEIFDNTQGWIARGLNKKISFPVTRLLVKTPITPNQITILNLIMGLFGCLLFLSPSWVWQVFGAFLIQLNSILDGCDGEVARLKVQSSEWGGWLDTMADDILNNVMLFCLVWGVYAQTGQLWFAQAGLATLGASLGVTFFIYDFLIRNKTCNAAHFRLSWETETSTEGNERSKKSWFDLIKPILKRDFFIMVVFVFALLNIRQYLLFFFLPIWGAFFLYGASFVYERFRKNNQTARR